MIKDIHIYNSTDTIFYCNQMKNTMLIHPSQKGPLPLTHFACNQLKILVKLGIIKQRRCQTLRSSKSHMELDQNIRPNLKLNTIRAIIFKADPCSTDYEYSILLKKTLWKMKNLENLSISLMACNFPEVAEYLCSSVKALCNLRSFSILMEERCYYYALLQHHTQQFQNLGMALRRLKSLEKVELELSGLFLSSKSGPIVMSSLLDSVSRVKTLKFKLPGFSDDIQDSSLNSMIKSISGYKNLKRLKLDFGELSSNRSVKLVSKYLSGLSSLESLEIFSFFQCGVTDQGLCILFNELMQLEELRELGLFFDSASEYITPNCLCSLYHSLTKLSKLTNFEFSFPSVDTRHFLGCLNDLQNLTQVNVYQLSSLQNLHLDLTTLRTIDIKLSASQNWYLGELFSKLGQLRDLRVQISHNIADMVAGPLSRALQYLERLEILTLKIGTIDKANELPKLWNAISKLPRLRDLTLDFAPGVGAEFNDSIVKSLAKSLRSLKVQNLKLLFMYGNKLTDEGINDIQEFVSSLTRLRYLRLSLGKSDFFTPEKIRSFLGNLLLSDINHLHISLYSSPAAEHDLIVFLKSNLPHARSFKKIEMKVGCNYLVAPENNASIDKWLM